MEQLHIDPIPYKTPYIFFDPDKGEFTIKGMSCSENAGEFYKPVLDWLDKYIENPSPNGTLITVNLEYFNTSSAKCLMDVFEKIARLNKKGYQIKINWYYEEDDEDMYMAIEDFSEVIDLPFNMIAC